jgi:hypothetical protein
MKFRVEVIGINPAPERVLQSSGQYIEGCRIWAKSHLEALPVDARHANAEAVIYRVDLVEVERVKRDIPVMDLKDEVSKIIEDITTSLTKEGQTPIPPREIAERLMETLNRIGNK